MPKVSIIVPVYNVKDYLKKCFDSVLAQTEPDFELLLIDDGSTDGSGELCDRLAGTDRRARVIHQENKGLGGARNTGVHEAVGDWLMFLDSDDYIDPQLAEKAISAGEREDAEIVVFTLRTVDESGKRLAVFPENFPTDRALDPGERKDIITIAPAACTKLYRREFFVGSGLRFPSRVWYEDIRTTPKLLALAKRVVFIDYVGYNYLQRQGSIMNNSSIDRNVEIIYAFDDLLGWFRDNGLFHSYRDELKHMCLAHIYLVASVRVIRMDPKHPLIKEFAKYTEAQFPDYKTDKYMAAFTRNEKIVLHLLKRHMFLAVALIFKIKDIKK